MEGLSTLSSGLFFMTSFFIANLKILLKTLEHKCTTFEELKHGLDGYTTNIPNIRRSDEYEVL